MDNSIWYNDDSLHKNWIKLFVNGVVNDQFLIEILFGSGKRLWSWEFLRSFDDCKMLYTELCKTDKRGLVYISTMFPFKEYFAYKDSINDETILFQIKPKIECILKEIVTKCDFLKFDFLFEFLDIKLGLFDFYKNLIKFQSLYRKYKVKLKFAHVKFL